MWKNRRRIVALLGGAAVLLLPFLRIRGRSAACIDACREVTSRRNVAPFIAYRGTVLRGKAYLFAGGCLAAVPILLAAIRSRPDVRFAVQWEGKAGTPGEILITAAGREFRIVRKAVFP